MLDAIVLGVAEIAGPRVRVAEGVNRAVTVEVASSLVRGKGVAEKANEEGLEVAGEGGGEQAKVIRQEVRRGAKMGSAGKEVVEVEAEGAFEGLGGKGGASNEAFDDEGSFDVFRLQGVKRGNAIPVQVEGAKELHRSEHCMF